MSETGRREVPAIFLVHPYDIVFHSWFVVCCCVDLLSTLLVPLLGNSVRAMLYMKSTTHPVILHVTEKLNTVSATEIKTHTGSTLPCSWVLVLGDFSLLTLLPSERFLRLSEIKTLL